MHKVMRAREGGGNNQTERRNRNGHTQHKRLYTQPDVKAAQPPAAHVFMQELIFSLARGFLVSVEVDADIHLKTERSARASAVQYFW